MSEQRGKERAIMYGAEGEQRGTVYKRVEMETCIRRGIGGERGWWFGTKVVRVVRD